MEYREFIEEVKGQLKELAGGELRIKVQRVQKNNGVCLDGISIWREGENVSPTIYLDPFYENYQKGESVSEIVSQILETYERYRIEKPVDPKFFCDFSNIRERIMCKVINYEKNCEFLKQIPHLRYLDLAVVFYCVVQDERIGRGTILIHNNHLKFWNVTIKEIAEIAKRNTIRKCPHELLNMIEVITQGMSDEDEKIFVQDMTEQEEERMPMYVLTNGEKNLGAVCVVYDSILEDVGKALGEDYYVLPSSIHECIIVPKREGIDPSELKAIVREVNETQVQPEEVLSDEIYQYERRYHRLSMVLESEEEYPFFEAEIVL
ncbi:MAG: DUF5688 family protein [Lachnospiraceae bacterium]|nr:DUF5688 family protein [Robinsoniella sp.]MDY3767409.1 DUF5688 family protein [Lachnospiraceae bacterium]